MCIKRIKSLVCCLLHGFVLYAGIANAAWVSRYDVVWESPSEDASGQMPLGNGDIAAGVCAIENGALYLLLAKNDAFTYNGDIFKTGRVRIDLEPNPFAKGKAFKQTLDLATGSVLIEADDVRVRVWADANKPVYHVQIDSSDEIRVMGRPDLWTRFDDCDHNVHRAPIEPPTQDVIVERNGNYVWYFAVGDRSMFDADMEYYGVADQKENFNDPYRFNTFGNLLESPDLTLEQGGMFGKGREFDIRIHALTKQTPEVEEWLATIEAQAAQAMDVKADWSAHAAWWEAFWEKSRIVASDNTLPDDEREVFYGETFGKRRQEKDGGALVAQSYNVFRYIMACQSRGRNQTKFNGGLFTQPLRGSKDRPFATQIESGEWLSHPDDRLWGRRYTYQNQRLLYWPLLMSGDFEIIQPFFAYYFDLLPVRKAITKAWFGHAGAYYRENIEPTGAERDCGLDGRPPKTKPGENKGDGYYHSYYFTSGLETATMMLEYVKHSRDTDFRDNVLVPFAREVLLFFDKHYERGADGQLRLDPAMVLETFWVAVNPAPDVAGLTYCLDELLLMNAGTDEDRAAWKAFRAEIPPIHLEERQGRMRIAPAEEYAVKRNAENGSLYPVFPFQCFSVGKGTKDIVEWTMKYRVNKNAFNYRCWTQDQIHWAYAGNAAEAKAGLEHRFRDASPQCRFPLYGSTGPDSCPDFDHFGSGSTALQRMLIQEADGKILLLPAWPEEWDADFKLHLTQQTVIEGKVLDGELKEWTITPEARKADVAVYEPQVTVGVRLGVRGGRIPPNEHTMMIGVDQNGNSKFSGEIARVSVFKQALSGDDIQNMVKTKRSEKPRGHGLVQSAVKTKPGDVLSCSNKDLSGDVTLEAWIKPGANEKGRILDKVTAGINDGLLFDTHPGLSVRLIVGDNVTTYKDVLTANEWQHVAVVITADDLQVYVDGKLI